MHKYMHEGYHMRTTVNLREDLLKRAMKLSNIQEKTALLHAGLEALIAKYARMELVNMGGIDKKSRTPRRRKSSV